MTEEQRDVWYLAKEIMLKEAGAIDPSTFEEVSGTKTSSGNSSLDWAISYFGCMPKGRGALVMKYHEGEVTRLEAMSARASIRWFYKRLQRRRLYGTGLRMLENLK